MGSDQHPRILDDGCCYNVSVFTEHGSRMEQSAVEPWITAGYEKIKKADVGDGPSHRNDTQPAINLEPNGLTSFGSAETQMTQAASNSAPLPNLIYARAAESFEAPNRVPHLERSSSRNFARPVGGPSFWITTAGPPTSALSE